MAILANISNLFDADRPLRSAALLLAVAVCGPSLWLLVEYAQILRLRRKMPPGPFPLPLVGNFFSIPKVKPWIAWEKLSHKYGSPMVTLWNGHRPIIVCNDIWCISDLLDKRANIYSSRPHFVVMGDMMNQSEANQVCQVYGDRWRLHRRLTHTAVGTQVVKKHRDAQANESKVLALHLMEDPDNFELAVERYSTSVVSMLGWGRRIDKINDPVGQVALAFMEGVDFVVPGLYIMEAIPWLAKLPGWLYPLPSKILSGTKLMQKYFTALSREGATAQEDNFSKRLIAAQNEDGLKDEDVACLTANLIGGGVDTTSSSILTFILAMCVFPEAQNKAHEELDSVVGRERSPNWSDEDNLPYIKAAISEALRWRTDTSITGNMWAIHRHPREFPEPDVYRPERFLNGLERPYPNKKGHNAFGWGRRQCSGQPLAEQGLYITISRLLWAFEIRPGLDDMGNEEPLDIFAYTKSENMRPEKFKARFIPRSEKIAELIRSEATAALEDLGSFAGETKVTMQSVM
ncbi:cytochrome P450 [Lineolata rhizophorae]|uniref:Cytochrome P450 n=1 Tax=Lineolata rhizophorae TaxID=578093 RepID=A0A6A6P662_9PEZI|nr:cytochrome P450 [Lineolata rhizophorae]